MLRAIILVVLVGGLLVLLALAGRHFFSHSDADLEVTSAPTIQQIREVGELVLLRIPIRDVVTADVSGWSGGNSLVLIVHGEVGIGVDLTQADYDEIDHADRRAVLSVPEPKVMYAKLDHNQTRIHSLSRSGLWNVAIGNAGEDQLVNAAYEKAQRVLDQAASDPSLIHRAKEQADHTLNELFGKLDWTLSIR